MKNEKGFVQMLLIVGIVILVGVIGYLYYNQNLKSSLTGSIIYNPQAVASPYQQQYQQSGQAIAPIQNPSDLNKTATSLDTTDTTQLDTNLNSLNSASSGF